MKKFYLLILFFCLCNVNGILAQISHGGTPLFLENFSLRSSNSGLEFIKMPSFDLKSVLKSDSLEQQDMRSSFRFAYKFRTHIEKGLKGVSQVLEDGTKVWRVGISSEGAYSINLLFTRYHVPEGGKLFIYNADHTHIVGSFDHRNNSDDNLLPIRPVAGDAIIVEYSEPANAEFEGELIIGEVNHDYRGVLRTEPSTGNYTDNGNCNQTYYLCMPDVLCETVEDVVIRSTVLLVIDGLYFCTGSLVNNTEEDGTPYLLTAVHCLNHSISVASGSVSQNWEYYVSSAGSIIAFFNYNRPVCGTEMKATEEQSISGAYARAIIENKDIALLELKKLPPVCYNAYYAGWNIDPQANNTPPFTNIHHPKGAVKKYGWVNKNLPLRPTKYDSFDANTCLQVAGWNTGSTWGGSSGSPLFDSNNLIIGTLTGGLSECAAPNYLNPNGVSDWFAATYKGWTLDNSGGNMKTYDVLKTFLDPNNTGKLKQTGYDPHKNNPIHRIANANYNNGDQLVSTQLNAPNSGYVFGNSNLSAVEFAEEFNLSEKSELFGVYLLIPTMQFSYTSGVEVEIYSGTNTPETLLAKNSFIPQYSNYSGGNISQMNKSTNSVPTETFVVFDQPVNVNEKFFVAYKINYSTSNQFRVYNTVLSSGKANTAWIKDGSEWKKATDYTPYPCTTSLALQPLLRYRAGSSIPEISQKEETIYYDKTSHQLHLGSAPENSGEIFVYSVNGQLIEHIPFVQGEQSVRITARHPGTIGVVRVIAPNKAFSGKIIY